MAIEKTPPEEIWLAAIERRSRELVEKIADKRDAAKFLRREADEKDAEANDLRDELDALNVFRPQLSAQVGS